MWWVHNDSEHWLEVKTILFHNNTRGLNKHYKDRITDDLDKENYLRPSFRPYHLYHLLIIFDDKKHNNGNWLEDVYSIYNDYKFKIEDKWTLELDERRTLKSFLHFKPIDSN